MGIKITKIAFVVYNVKLNRQNKRKQLANKTFPQILLVAYLKYD